MWLAPKTLKNAFEMAVQSKKTITLLPKLREPLPYPLCPWTNLMPHCPWPNPKLAALEDIETDHKLYVAAMKSKLNKCRCNHRTSSSIRSSSKGSNMPASGLQKPNPDKNVKCCYCNNMCHYQLVSNPPKCDGAPMVRSDGTPYTQCANTQVFGPLQYAP